jgi:membrane associated rhomboid family serine protease
MPRRPSAPFPALTALLVALNVGAFLWQLLHGLSPWTPTSAALVAAGGNAPFFTLAGQGWRLATSIFLHGGVMHLGLNMLALAFTGPRAEEEFGPRRTLVLYLGGGLIASCASAWWSVRHLIALAAAGAPLSLGVSVGASGAIMALFGGLLAAALFGLPTAQDRQPAPVLDRRLLEVIAINIGAGFLLQGIDQAAHVGGLLGGFALGTLLAIGRGRGGRAVAALRVLLCLALVAGCIALLMRWGDRLGLSELREPPPARLRVLPAPQPAPDEGAAPAERV